MKEWFFFDELQTMYAVNTYILFAHKDDLMDYLAARHKLGLEVVKRKTNFL